MSRPGRTRLAPWIETLILSYGSREEAEVGGGRLKAHVIGVGQMSPSQSSDGPSGLLFLSDGALQIPAVLTAAGWAQLQEQEDRESLASLLNSTALLRGYHLRFHAAPEQTRSRFFLSVGGLATTAAGPVRDNPPCCTTLPSVRRKICQTWRALLGGDSQSIQGGLDLSELLGGGSQSSQGGLDLSELLGGDSQSIQGGLDLSELLGGGSQSSQGGLDLSELLGGGSQSSQGGLDLSELLGEWQHDCLREVLEDVRRRLGGAGCRPGTPPPSTSAHSESRGGDRATGWDLDRVRYKGGEPFCVPTAHLFIPGGDFQHVPGAPRPEGGGGSTPPPAESPRSQTPPPTGVWDGGGGSPVSNPWDMFPPPSVSCSPDSSLEPPPQHDLAAATATGPDSAATATSTQLPVLSYFPPYQKPPSAPQPASSPPVDPPGAPDPDRTPTPPQNLLAPNSNGKRKRCEETPEREGGPSGSPPSWLFDSQTRASGLDEGGSPKWTGTAPRQTLVVHADGRPFRYSYTVTGQNLLDLSRFRVAAARLQWAVRYLVGPKEAGGPPEGT